MIFYALHVSLFPGISRLLEMLCLFTLHFYFTGFWPSSCFHWVKVVRGELGVKRKSDSFSLSPPSALHQDLNFCLHRTNQYVGRVQSTFQAAEHFTSGDVLFFFQIARTSIQSCLEFLGKKKCPIGHVDLPWGCVVVKCVTILALLIYVSCMYQYTPTRTKMALNLEERMCIWKMWSVLKHNIHTIWKK